MKMTRNNSGTPRISLWGSFLAVIVINTSLNNCQQASAFKEEVDEQALSPKSNGDNSQPGFDQSFPNGEYDPWKEPSCLFYPCTPSNYYYYGDGNPDPDVFKRNFNPWGGKRSPLPISNHFRIVSELLKKGSFNPWGGKRNPNSSPSSRSTKNEYPSVRRLPFNPWGGR